MTRSTSASTFCSSGAGQGRDVRQRPHDDALADQVVQRQDASWSRPSTRDDRTTCAGVRIGPAQPLGRVLGPQRLPRGRVLVGVARHRAAGEPELRRAIVGHQQQPSAPSAYRTCSAWYSTPRRRPPTDRAGESGACASTTQTSLVLRFSDERTTRSPVRLGRHVDLELAVRVLHDQHVVGGRCAEAVPPDLVLAPQVVVHDVEERRGVGRPGAGGRAARQDVRELRPGRQVAEAQLVDSSPSKSTAYASTRVSGETAQVPRST